MVDISKALKFVRSLPPAENSRLTQIATTGPSYRKALSHLERAGIEGRAIDYGAGRGHGLREIGADTFEPYPQGWSPTYTKPEEIPDEVYRRLVNLNVLNVLDPQARESAVLNMGRIVEPGGGGVISTRGRDVMSARGEPGPEPMSLIIGEGDQARYQKGFTPRELREYVGDTLGSRFDVEPSDVGQASIMFRRNREDGGAVDYNDAPNYALDAETSRFNMGDVFAPLNRSLSQGKNPSRAENIPLARPVAPPEPDVVNRALGVVRAEPRPMDIKVSRQAPPPPRPVPRPAPRPAPAPAQAAPDASESRRLWEIYNETGNPADFVRASNAMRAGRAEGGEVREGYDKGGIAKKAIDAARRIMGYTDPPTKKIEDWQWRPLADVDKELGLREIPPHVQQFGDYMREMSDRAAGEGLSARDLIKGFTTTRASIQRQAVDADKLRALGLDLPSDVARIRPEGAWAEWLMTPMGQRYLDAASKGTVEGDAVANAIKIMSPFGRHETDIPDAMRWAAENLPGREARASDLVARAAEGASSPAEWRQFTSDIRGVGPSKSGFLASLYGRGDQPTLDARQIILNTGAPTKEAAKYISRGRGEGGVEAVDRLAARQSALGLEAPSRYDPFYQHLAHHSIWDKASNETTTHADVVNAMRNAGIVLGVPAAGAAVMPEDQPVERASGGRLLEDEYPTHYLPNVGRQVMADGGTPDDDIRRYEARMADIARQPEDIRSMTHAPSRPMRPIQIEGGLIGKRTLGEAPYDVAGPLSGIAQTAYSLKTLPFYFTPAAPLAAAADFGEAAIDTAKAAREGDYLGAGITGALGVAMPGYAYRKPIGDVVGRALSAIRGNPAAVGAGAAGAAMVAPEDAEAGKLDAAIRAARNALSGAETLRGADLVAKDPRAATVNLSKRTPSGEVDFGQGINNAEYTFTSKGDLQPWKEFDPYQAYKERALIAGLLGDRSAAGSLVHDINGVRLTEPVNRTGGGEFQRSTEGPEVWASRPSAVKNMYTRINKGMSRLGASSDTPVLASHIVMGLPGIDSTQMMAKSVLRQIEPTRGNIDPNVVEAFDASVRKKYPGWPGILNPEEAEAFLAKKEVGKRTSTILQMLDNKRAQVGGLPNLGAARFAMMEPRLVSADQGATGFAISRLDPNRVTNAAVSDTYPTGMLGPSRSSEDYVGGTRYQIPLNVMFPDWSKKIKPTYVEKKTGLTKATTPTQIQQSVLTQVPLQRASQEWLDNLMAYMEANPKKWGYRRGGSVSHRALMIAQELGSLPRETVKS